jgi:hypothetical protein
MDSLLPISDFQLPISGIAIAELPIGIGNCQSEMSLSLRELEALAGALLAILLAFLDARVARDQARLLQRRSQISVVFEQRARNTMTDGACLARRASASHIDQDVKLCNGLRQLQWLSNNHAQSFIGKICIECFAIDFELAPTGA